jgi:SAM-dependent methyltransferase
VSDILLSNEEVLAGYDAVSQLYPHIPSLLLWRAWEFAAYRRYALRQPVLDVGCGDGRFFRLVWPGIKDVYGIDQQPAAVERAIQSGVYRCVWRADAAALPGDIGPFESVFANCSLEHMDNIDGVLASVRRTLVPGGMFLFSVVTDNIARWFSPATLVRALGEEALASHLFEEWLHYHHLVNQLPVEHWCAALVQAGFEVIEHIPIIPEMSARLFLLLDGLWHIRQGHTTLGQQLHQRLQQVPQFAAGFRGILQSALMMETDHSIGCGAVIVAKVDGAT